MLPIAVPAAQTMGLPLAPFVAASLAGGVFGDHSSPISDTTIISSMAAATDHIDHVRTQLPYALLAGLVAALGFAICLQAFFHIGVTIGTFPLSGLTLPFFSAGGTSLLISTMAVGTMFALALSETQRGGSAAKPEPVAN